MDDKDARDRLKSEEDRNKEWTDSAEAFVRMMDRSGEPEEPQEKTAGALGALGKDLRNPVILGSMAIVGIGAGLLNYVSHKPRPELGGVSKAEEEYKDLLDRQHAKGEEGQGYRRKLQNRFNEFSGGLAKANREHPVASTALSSLLGLGTGYGVAKTLGAGIRMIKRAGLMGSIASHPGAAMAAGGAALGGIVGAASGGDTRNPATGQTVHHSRLGRAIVGAGIGAGVGYGASHIPTGTNPAGQKMNLGQRVGGWAKPGAVPSAPSAAPTTGAPSTAAPSVHPDTARFRQLENDLQQHVGNAPAAGSDAATMQAYNDKYTQLRNDYHAARTAHRNVIRGVLANPQ